MYDYIRETPGTLRRIIDGRSQICSEFVSLLRDKTIDQIYILGSGTSYHAGVSAKPLIEEVMGCRVTPMYPTQFSRDERFYGENALVVGVSQGGQSLSTVEGLDAANAGGIITTALSANPAALVFEHSAAKTMLEVGNERCGAKTKGYGGSILTLMLMFAELAEAKGLLTDKGSADYLRRIEAVIENMVPVIDAADAWYKRIGDEFEAAKRIMVVGYEGLYGDVLEGALKILETVRQGVTGYDIEEFFHGIYNSVNEDSYLFFLAPASDYKQRTLKLIEILGEWTSHNYLIAAPDGQVPPDNRYCLAPFLDDPLFSCLEYILPLQVIACKASMRLGIDPSIPKDPLFHARIGSKKVNGAMDRFGTGVPEA